MPSILEEMLHVPIYYNKYKTFFSKKMRSLYCHGNCYSVIYYNYNLGKKFNEKRLKMQRDN